MRGSDNNTDSGVYYIVPKQNGRPVSNGRHFIRKPRSPQTSTPLDDDFDANTHDRTTMYNNPGQTPGGDRYSWIPTQAPLESDFDAMTYTNFTGGERLNDANDRDLDMGMGGMRQSEYWVHQPPPSQSSRNGTIIDHINRRQTHSSSTRNGVQSPRVQSPHTIKATASDGQRLAAYPSDDFAARLPRSSSSRQRLAGKTPTQNGKADSSINRYDLLNTPIPFQHASSSSRRSNPTNQREAPSASVSRNYSERRIVHQPSGSTTRPKKRNAAAESNSIKHPTTNGNGLRAPIKKQSYEMIRNRVLEDGPEKTVTILTWRERVANEMNGRNGRESEVEMSVYYVNADDYVEENARVFEGPESVDSRRRKGKGNTSRNRSVGRTDEPHADWLGSKSPRLKKAKLGASMNGSRKGKEKAVDMDETPRPRSRIRNRVQTPWPSGSDLDEIIEEDNDDLGLNHRRSRSLPIEWDHNDHNNQHEWTLPRTSTPIRDKTTSSSARHNGLKGHNHNGVPVKSLESLSEKSIVPKSISLFTRSGGSSISSIRGPNHPTGSSSIGGKSMQSTQPSSVQALDVVLSSCEPSLLHIGPTLMALGIRTEDHLRAVANLSEMTRDKEVKEAALKNGITVVEWAILLDKLHSLCL